MNRSLHCVQHQQEEATVGIGNFSPPPPSQKKYIIAWSGSDEGKIALHSLDLELRLASGFFFCYARN